MNTDDYNGMEGPCKAGWVIWPFLIYATIGAVLAAMAWYLLPSMIVKQALAHEVTDLQGNGLGIVFHRS